MSNKRVVLIVVGILIFTLWWMRDDEPSPSVEVIEITPPPTKTSKVTPSSIQGINHNKQKQPAAPTVKPQQTSVKPLEEPPPAEKLTNPYKSKQSWAPFEVIDNFVVVQKDVLFGKVRPDFEHKTGRFKPEPSRLWPSNVIPYYIDPNLPNKQQVQSAIDYMNSNTVMQFIPFVDQEDALWFKPHEELCASYLGRMGGHQPIFLSSQCQSGSIVHELMHALGFVHEHSRADRDNFLEVIWSNITEAFWPQFALLPDALIHNYSGSVFEFDFHSIMLYGPNAFAKSSGLVTLRSKNGDTYKPNREELSNLDKERLYYLYGN